VLFTEARFALLVVAAWITFAVAAPRRRAWALALWGAIFYVSYAPAAVPVVFGLIVAVYLIARRAAIAAIVLPLTVLAYYKAAVPPPAAAAAGSASLLSAAPALMPLGLSFLAFELIHFAIERRRGRIPAAPFPDYLSYALYFPCRVAGPIRRYPEFQRAVANAVPTVANVYTGFVRVLVGIAKKVAIADLLGLTVAEAAYAATPLHAAKVLLAYSFQLYLDFSAYSDVAIGISRMFGIVVPENFNYPYASQSIQEFWTRWHMSLSFWVRDYIFLPLGRRGFATPLRSRPLVIAAGAYLVAFLAVGAWHGLSANFLLWGAYHGALLGGHHVYRRTVAERVAAQPFYHSAVANVVSVGVTFAAVAAGWILFLTPDPGSAWRLARTLAGL
jgi:alginate O-acetyltransferase complex protein AlgI